MSDERIDLTQFEGIGEWKVLEYWDEEEARYEIRTGRDNHSKHEAEVIAKLPNLIAELKRCYEMIDRLRPIAQDWVKLDAHTDDGKCLILDMEDSDGNCFSGYINRASE